MVGLVLALGSALAYGVSDFLGGLCSRRTSPYTIALLSQLVGASVLVLAAASAGGAATGADLAWGAASGVGSGLGTVFLYRGLGRGAMNVVAPLSAVGAASLPVLVGVLTGERPSALAWAGIGCALPAIWLVSRTGGGTGAGRAAAVRDGLLAGAGFGLLFIALGQVPDGAGLWPLASGQTVAALMIGLCVLAIRVLPRPDSTRTALGAIAAGLGAAAATILFQAAVQAQLVSLAAVLASLYPALTVALAAFVLHERVSRVQGIGLALALAAVLLVAAG